MSKQRLPHYLEADRLMGMCVDKDGNPPPGPSPELHHYIALAQVNATMALMLEVRRLNDRGDRFNAAMLDLFERLADPFEAPPEGPSGAGATAQVVEKEGP